MWMVSGVLSSLGLGEFAQLMRTSQTKLGRASLGATVCAGLWSAASRGTQRGEGNHVATILVRNLCIFAYGDYYYILIFYKDYYLLNIYNMFLLFYISDHGWMKGVLLNAQMFGTS